MPARTFILGMESREIEGTCTPNDRGFEIRFNSAVPFEVQVISSGDYRVIQSGNSWRARAVADGDRCWVFINGHVGVVSVQNKTGRHRAKESGHSHALSAPTPATVIELCVAEGQTVKKGQALIVLEAMKMEFPIKAPADGIIRKVNCKERQIVQSEMLLIEFEN